MKVLLISEDEEKTELLKEALSDCNSELIFYRWFLKALDNIEEIAPEVILINTEDFPRHWKILCQFTKEPLFSKPVKIVLYIPENFSQEEMDKAITLKVLGCISSKEKEEIRKEFLKLISSIENGNADIEQKPENLSGVLDFEAERKKIEEGGNMILESSFKLYTVDTLIEDKDFLPTVDNLIEDKDFLFTVDNLLEFDDFEGYEIEDISVDTEKISSESEDLIWDTKTSYDSVKPVENAVSSENKHSDTETVSAEAVSEEETNETEPVYSEEAKTETSCEGEIVVPTVSSLIGNIDIEKTGFKKDAALLSEIQNVLSKNLTSVSEEDIQNELTLYTVDSLFGLEDNGYNIKSVDNLFYEPEGMSDSVPKSNTECRKLFGSLLHRIMEYYENK